MSGDKNEEVLLKVNNVKYKKNDGHICVTHKRIGWILGNSQTYAVSVQFTEIKSKLYYIHLIELLY